MNDKIIILGINWEQNSSAALMIDGKIVSAISEERFSRKKNDESYPKNAIDFVLKYAKLSLSDVDKIAKAIPNEVIDRNVNYETLKNYANEATRDTKGDYRLQLFFISKEEFFL